MEEIFIEVLQLLQKLLLRQWYSTLTSWVTLLLQW